MMKGRKKQLSNKQKFQKNVSELTGNRKAWRLFYVNGENREIMMKLGI